MSVQADTYQTAIESGEEGQETLGRLVVLFVCIAQPL